MRPERELHAGRVAIVWALAVVGLIVAFQSPAGRPQDSIPWPLLAAVALMAAAASLYRRSETSSGGAPLLLPLLVVNGGGALGAALFACAVGAASWTRAAFHDSIDPHRAFLAAGRAAVAALAVAFLQPAGLGAAGLGAGTLETAGSALLAFLAVGWLLDGLTARERTLAGRWGSPLPSLAIEGISLALGIVTLRFDRTATLLLLVLAVVLLFDGARQGWRFDRAERRRLAALADADRARRIDPGLEVFRRDELLAQLDERFRSVSENASRLAVVAFDPDALERRNTRLGFAAGDRLLRSLVDLARQEFGPGCLMGRYQGATLAVLVPGADCAAALASAEALRRRFESRRPEESPTTEHDTVCCGVAAYPELPVRQGEELLLLAEGALRLAKRRGRNRCLADLGGHRFLDGFGQRVQTADEEERELPRTPTFFA
jgi:diguanylate cyclase (GGDEF)-like protein